MTHARAARSCNAAPLVRISSQPRNVVTGCPQQWGAHDRALIPRPYAIHSARTYGKHIRRLKALIPEITFSRPHIRIGDYGGAAAQSMRSRIPALHQIDQLHSFHDRSCSVRSRPVKLHPTDRLEVPAIIFSRYAEFAFGSGASAPASVRGSCLKYEPPEDGNRQARARGFTT